MTEIEAAWLAGLLDGEGSFMIIPERTGGYPRWTAQVSVASTDERIVLRCKDLAGGKLSSGIQPLGNAKQARIWTATGRYLNTLLPAVIPHMISRREQAEILLALRCEMKAGARPGEYGVQSHTEATKTRREIMRLAVKALNHRGTTATPPEQLEALAEIRRNPHPYHRIVFSLEPANLRV